MAKGSKGNGGASQAAQEQTIAEPAAEIASVQEPHDAGAAEVPLASGIAESAPDDKPGPEDFERQTLAELKAGKAADMKLRANLERQLAEVKDRESRRDAVFAPRFIQEAAAKKIQNPILEIDGTKLVPRAKKGGAGGFITFRDRAPLDI